MFEKGEPFAASINPEATDSMNLVKKLMEDQDRRMAENPQLSSQDIYEMDMMRVYGIGAIVSELEVRLKRLESND